MDPLTAARAYGAVQKQVSGLSEPQAATEGMPNFSHMVQNALDQTYQSTKNAETQMALNASGKAELVDAVTAIASAQANLEGVIAIRDQVISAYQEIMRMQI
jgi:flagellar hook-basal body complex protein FliE